MSQTTLPDHRIAVRGPQTIARPIPDRAVEVWLTVVAAMVLAIVVVGGATRLTDSGLSITEWRPILGVIPPLTAADWQIAFDKYRQIPQYQTLNRGMSLAEFQVIYGWEWAHRLLGRAIGLALAVPLAVLWITGRLRPALAARIFGIGLLVGLQGAIGWYMVQSGLTDDRIYVSPYRLVMHLSMAFLILACLVWVILDLSPPSARPPAAARPVTSPLTRMDVRWAWGLAALTFAQVAIGGLVAGLKAGRAYNTWPTMDGQWIPDGLFRMSPWWLNLTENMTTVQFDHRLTAYVLVGLALWHAIRLWRSTAADPAPQNPALGAATTSAVMLAAGLLIQMGIGIWTVIAAVPIGLGVTHQGVAAIVFAIAVWHVHAMRRAAL